MRMRVGTKIVSGYIISLGVFILICVLALVNINNLIETEEAVRLTVDEMDTVDAVNTLISEAESAVMISIMLNDAESMQEYSVIVDSIESSLRSLKTLAGANASVTELILNMENSVKPIIAVFDSIIAADPSSTEYRNEITRKLANVNTLHSTYLTTVDALNTELSRLDTLRSDRSAANAEATKLIIYLSIPVMLILIFILGFLITRSIVLPLKEAIGIADRISTGDLSGDLSNAPKGDEIGLLLSAFDKMAVSLRGSISELLKGINVLSSSTVEIMSSTSQVSSGAVETASAISETSSTVEQVKQGAQFASEKSKLVSDATEQAVQISEKGLNAVDLSIDGMNKIKNQVEFIAESLVQLSEQSQAIGEIINSVNDLAEQSNLLAVNASIEAAKAGEHGKGFSVVAQEVKILAEQSKEATNQVRKILNDILKATNTAVMSTEKGNEAVQMGVKQSYDASEAIKMMVEHIGKANQSAIQINVTNQQQLTGMKQINEAMENIHIASNHNLDGNKQVEASLQDLKDLSHRLKDIADRFTL